MNFFQLVDDLIHDTVSVSLGSFLPELTLCAAVVALLVVRMLAPAWWRGPYWIVLAGALLALALLVRSLAGPQPGAVFTGLLVHDAFAAYLRALLIVFLLLFVLLTRTSGVPAPYAAADFYVLVLGAVLGMCLMVSSNHVLVVFLGIEMASVPSYVLAGILKYQRQGSEAALKFAVFGAATAGIMLYGLSLLAGIAGTAQLPALTYRLAVLLGGAAGHELGMVLMLAGVMVLVGLAFKASAVPFQFWVPDVFEGAAAEVGALLSVASKAAAVGLVLRLVMCAGQVDPQWIAAARQGTTSATAQATAFLTAAPIPDAVVPGEQAEPVESNPGESPGWPSAPAAAAADQGVDTLPDLARQLAPVREFFLLVLALLSALTCTFGNLAAYGQTNMKRLLAYSTIAHAGYMLMPVAAAAAALGADRGNAQAAAAGVGFYLAVYLFMNLGAFAAVAMLRNTLGSEQIADYAGLIGRAPGFVVCVTVMLFSLVGLPPLAGFVAKFAIFAPMVATGFGVMLLLVVIGVLNTVLSLFYYLRVVKVMVMDPEPADRADVKLPILGKPGLYCLMLTLPLVVLGVWWNELYAWAHWAAASLVLR